MLTQLPAATRPLSAEPTALPLASSKLVGISPAGAVVHYLVASLFNRYDVRFFGAIGDGVTDDTAAIAAAIAAAPVGATVYFPPGIYITTAPLIVTAGIILLGQHATIKSNAYTDGVKIAIVGSNVSIVGLVIDGGYSSGLSAYTGGGLITVINSSSTAVTNIQILDCTIKNSSFVGIAPQDYVDRLVIKNCEFTNNWCSIYFGTSSGSSWKSNTNCEVVGCRFHHNWGIGGQSGACKNQGDYTRSTADAGPQNFIFAGNSIHDAGEMGIEIWKNGYLCNVSDNVIDGCVFAVSLDGVSHSVVTGNVLSDFDYCGVEVVQSSKYCMVSGNILNGYVAGTSTRRSSGSQRGIISSGAESYFNKFIGNVITGIRGAGIELQRSDGCRIENNSIADCGSCVVLKAADRQRVVGNTFTGPVDQFVFLDYNDVGCTDIAIENNTFRGAASSDAITIYDNNHGNVLSNIRISGNDTVTATFGNIGVPGGINNLMANTPNFQVFGNRYLFSGGATAVKFIDSTTDLANAQPFDRVFQKGGISVAGRTVITLASSSVSQWVKIWKGTFGNPISVQLHVGGAILPSGTQTNFLCHINAAPYDQGCTFTVFPQAEYGHGIIEEVIYNNSGADQEIFLRIKTPMGAGSLVCSISEYKEGLIIPAVPTATEPTWASTVRRAYLKDFQLATYQTPRLYVEQSINSYAPTASFVGTAARLHIIGPGTEGGSSGDRIARFDTAAGVEGVGIDQNGCLVVGGGNAVSRVISQYGTPDFGNLDVGQENALEFGVGGARVASNPSVLLGWDGPLPAGIVVKHAYLSADNVATVVVRNTSGVWTGIGVRGLRVTVIQF